MEYRVCSTKVSKETYEFLMRLAIQKGMTVYELFQNIADTFVRYASDNYNLRPEMQRIMAKFEHADGWAGALNLADPSADKDIVEAIYFLAGKKKKGMRLMHVYRYPFGQWEQTANNVAMFERFMEVLSPVRYRKLRRLAVDLECNNLLELLDLLIDSRDLDEIDRELRKDFEDCRADNGKVYQYGARTKRKKHVDIDSPSMFREEDNHAQ